MAYTSFSPGSSSNLVQNLKAPFGGGSRWYYQTTDTSTTIAGSSYISDAAKFGVDAGDIIDIWNGTTGLTTWLVNTVRGSSTSSPSADLTFVSGT